MPTLAELTDEVISTLHGYTTDVPQMGTLVGPIGPTDTQLAIDFGGQPGAARPNGLIEIDGELIAVNSFNAQTGLALIGPWGRGQRNTAKASHAAGSMVTVRPRYPRKQVQDTIRQVVRAACPPLFQAVDTTIPGDPTKRSWALPAGSLRILRVQATYGTEVVPVTHWSTRPTDAGLELVLPWPLDANSLLVTTAADPGRLSAETDDFAAVTGLSEACADLVLFGALARLIVGVEAARQQPTSVEAQSRLSLSQPGTATQVSRYWQALYTQRLDAELTRLQQLYPIQLTRRG